LTLERRCNECTLCCKLLPVKEFNKSANTRCTFQRAGKGCAIHNGRTYPRSCRLWSCGWLIDPKASELARPDRAHYVIDPSPDFVDVRNDATQELIRMSVVQIWIDPKHPAAHRDPALRAYLLERAEHHGQLALIRYNSQDAITLVPPSLSASDEWLEITDRTSTQTDEHTAAEIVQWHQSAS
jgi:hypothetical protein